MPEEQELRLTVTLDDQATQQLQRLQQALQGIASSGGGSSNAATQLGNALRGAGGHAQGLQSSLLGMAAKGGFIAGAFFEIGRGLTQLGKDFLDETLNIRKYADAMSTLEQQANRASTSAAQFQRNIAVMRESGISAEAAAQNVQGFSDALADLQREQSRVRESLLAGLRGAEFEDMRSLINRVMSVDKQTALNEIKKFGQDIRDYWARQGQAERGALSQREFYAQFGVPELDKMRDDLREVTPEMDRMYARRMENAQRLQSTFARFSDDWERSVHSTQAMGLYLLPVVELFEGVESAVEAITKEIEKWEKRIGLGGEEDTGTFKERWNLPTGPDVWRIPLQLPGEQAPPTQEELRRQLQELGRQRDPAQDALRRQLEELGRRRMEEGGAQQFMPLDFMGGGMLNEGPGDRRASVVANTDQVKALTEEFKRLNDYFQIEEFKGKRVGLLGMPGAGRGGIGGGIGPGGYSAAPPSNPNSNPGSSNPPPGANPPPGGGPPAGFDPRTGYDPRQPGNAPAGQVPSLVGPYGQPMPAWGATTTGPIDFGGGTGRGVAGGVPSLAGTPGGRSLTPEERKAAAAVGGGGAGAAPAPGAPLVAGEGGKVAGGEAAVQARMEQIAQAQGLVGHVPVDGEKYGIKTGSAAEWGAFLTNLAKGESSFKVKSHGDIGQFGGAGSRGLFQLSPNDATTYGLRDKPYTIAELEDPDFNANVAAQIVRKLSKGEGPAAKVGVKGLQQGVSLYFGGNPNYTKGGQSGPLYRGGYKVRPEQLANRPEAPPQTADVGPTALPPPGTVPPGSRTSTGVQPAPGSVNPPATAENPPAASTPAATGAGGGVSFGTKIFGGKKGQPGSGAMPPQQLQNILEYAGRSTGVNTEIFAGIETGHHRHELSTSGGLGSADVKLRDQQGNIVSSDTPEGRKTIAAYIEAAARAGATGIGHAVDYMTAAGIHIGGSDGRHPALAWGAGGRAVNAPQWVKEAYDRGVKARLTPQQLQTQLADLRKKAQTQVASNAPAVPSAAQQPAPAPAPPPPAAPAPVRNPSTALYEKLQQEEAERRAAREKEAEDIKVKRDEDLDVAAGKGRVAGSTLKRDEDLDVAAGKGRGARGSDGASKGDISRRPADARRLDRSRSQRVSVNGKGNVKVEVKSDKGSGNGQAVALAKDTPIPRQTQNEPAKTGPQHDAQARMEE